jgi:amino acid transporter
MAKSPIDSGLKRRLGPALLTLYGLGVMVGAGIYVLVGSVAESAGLFAPLAFLVAGLIAAPTALTYSELSVRIPESAGEAAFVRVAFGSTLLSTFAGLAIVAIGVTSAAAVLRGGVGYLGDLVDAPAAVLIVGIAALLVLVGSWGVLEALSAAALFTLIEVVGLVLVIRAGFVSEASADWAAGLPESLPVAGFPLAVALAFFAFIGFEDMVNMAEEVRDPGRTMPTAIVASLVLTSVLYGAVSIAAVRAVDLDLLADSDRPLALVYERAGGSGSLLSAVAVAAALNGVLAQMVMAARVLFGLGRHQPWLARFHRTDRRFGTPVLATVTVGVAVTVFALALDVSALAEVTSMVLLAVFCVMNAALLAIKRRTPPAVAFTVPQWVPWFGLLASTAALIAAVLTA